MTVVEPAEPTPAWVSAASWVAAPVGGALAVALVRKLDDALAALEESAARRPELRAELPAARAQVEAMRQVARQWLLAQNWIVSAEGRADMAVADIGAGSATTEIENPPASEITVSEAAHLLGVGLRQARRYADRWAVNGMARKVGRAWLIDLTAVDLYRGSTM